MDTKWIISKIVFQIIEYPTIKNESYRIKLPKIECFNEKSQFK
jgi:hypothetical protein